MACVSYSKGDFGNYKDGEVMAILIKDKKKPPKCKWVTKNHDVCRCVMLDGKDDCVLQDCEQETWTEQYANCPLVEVPDEQPEIIMCKDCENWDTSWECSSGPGYHYCGMVDKNTASTFYCGDSERKTDGDTD